VASVTSCLILTAGDPTHPSGGHLYNQRLARALTDAGAAVGWHVGSSTGPLPAPSDVARLRQRLDRERPDIVLVDSIVLASALAIRRSGPRIVALMYYLPSRYPGHRRFARAAWALVQRLVLSRANLVVTMGDAERDDCLAAGAAPSRVVVAPPGRPDTPLAVELDVTPHPVRFLSVGHWLPAKGIHLVVEAFDRLGVPDATLTLVGSQEVDPGYARAVRAAIARSQSGGRIAAPGSIPAADVDGYYRAADVLVHASRSETFGAVVVEAMAAGCPVVASRLPSLQSLVEDGTSGFLVPPGSVDLLRDRMARLASDAPLRWSMARAAMARAMAHPTWRETTDRLTRLVATLATAAPRPAADSP